LLAFEFFYFFSRFEFCLKENGYLKSCKVGAIAEPGWDDFVKKYSQTYDPSGEARWLLASPPEKQIVVAKGELRWRPVGVENCSSELDKVALMVKTVRNNLFHGGKHGAAGWDDPARMKDLLLNCRAILEQLVALAGFEGDYQRLY